jgi:diadenosine tetraphosphate (Ap4A) HIT family hydrolase
MRVMSEIHDPNCGICRASLDPPSVRGGVVFQNDLWLLRRLMPARAVPGWMMIQTQRHTPGIAYFNDAEAASFGPTFRHLQKVLQDITGALRIYTASMNESAPHFHCHFVPRSAQMPKGAVGWEVFDLFRATVAGEITVDADEVARLTERYRLALRDNPPPR